MQAMDIVEQPVRSPEREALADRVEAIAQRQDRQAFLELFEHFAPRVKAYLCRLGASPPLADELTQEAMISVWRKAHTFDRTRSSVSTWLFTIARNKRIDMIRRDRRPELDPEDPALVPAAPPSAEEAVGTEQRDLRLRAAIAELPREQADLLELAFYEGRSHSEIASLRGLPLGTVKSRMRLAFTRLRRAMEDYR